MTQEEVVKQRIKSYLMDLGAWQFWPVSDDMGFDDIPDCVCCYKGKFYAFRVNAPGKRDHKNRAATEPQMLQIEEINNAGGVAAVVDCVSEVRALLNFPTQPCKQNR